MRTCWRTLYWLSKQLLLTNLGRPAHTVCCPLRIAWWHNWHRPSRAAWAWACKRRSFSFAFFSTWVFPTAHTVPSSSLKSSSSPSFTSATQASHNFLDQKLTTTFLGLLPFCFFWSPASDMQLQIHSLVELWTACQVRNPDFPTIYSKWGTLK